MLSRGKLLVNLALASKNNDSDKIPIEVIASNNQDFNKVVAESFSLNPGKGIIDGNSNKTPPEIITSNNQDFNNVVAESFSLIPGNDIIDRDSNKTPPEMITSNDQDINNAVAESFSLIPGSYTIDGDGTLIFSGQEPGTQDLIGGEAKQGNEQNEDNMGLDTSEVSEMNIMEVDNDIIINQEVEDMQNDPDYLPEEDNVGPNEADDTVVSSQDNLSYLTNPDKSSNEQDTNTKRTRKRKGDRKEWQRYKRQTLRKEGKNYIGRVRKLGEKDTEKEVSERKLGPCCKSQFCLKSKKRFYNEIPEGLRQELFTHFWANLSWVERKTYISSLVNCEVPKQKRRAESGDRRGSSFHYFIKINNDKKEVCRDMFCNTFGLGVWSVKNWSQNVLHGMNKKSENQQSADQQETQENLETEEVHETGNAAKANDKATANKRKEFAVNFINMLPKMEAHYCGKDTKKLYLEITFHSLMQLYRVYKNKCQEANIKMLSRFTFTEILNDMNVSLFQPKKDQCDICCKYRAGSLSQKDYADHVKAKTRAREEKSKDKTEAISKLCKVFSADVQAVKLAPFVMASALYFKTKLCCHNYTIYDLSSREVDCYWWNESEGELKAEIFSSFLINHLQLAMDKWPEEYPRVIKLWSDSCGYQNKNKTLFNALLQLAIKNNFTIHQKYLQVGHTQMEVDSVHAAIERKLKNREIYLPSDYIAATIEARGLERENDAESKNGKQKEIYYPPYRAHYITYDLFKDYTIPIGQRYSSIRPGNTTADPTVNDVCHFVYLPTGIIQYQINFDDELKPLPRRAKQIEPGINYPQLYKSRLKIKPAKWEHLQQLKAVLPQPVHYFYDNLPQ